MKPRNTAQKTAEALHDIARKITVRDDAGVGMAALVERIEDINTTFAKSIGYADQLAESRARRAKDHEAEETEFRNSGDRKHIRQFIDLLEEDDAIIIG